MVNPRRKEVIVNKLDLNVKKHKIKISGYDGTWYVIDQTKNGQYFLLEHEKHGDEVPALIVTRTGKIKLEDVCNGLEELEY